MTPLVLINSKAGTAAAGDVQALAEQIRTRFQLNDIRADVRIVDGEDLPETARTAVANKTHDALIAAGGDGTINTVASTLIDTGVALGIIPLGTFNHLAKELNMPPEDVDAAVDAMATGEIQPFNVGEVNGRIFLSFSAIGTYSEVIRHRDAQRRALGRRKWQAMVIALWRMFTRWPLMRVRLRVNDEPARRRRLTPLVLVALSEYQIKALGLETFSTTGREKLNIYLATNPSRAAMIWVMIKGLFRILIPARDFEVVSADTAEISRRHTAIRVGLDGEVIDLKLPLQYRLRRDALQIIKPPPPPPQNPP